MRKHSTLPFKRIVSALLHAHASTPATAVTAQEIVHRLPSTALGDTDTPHNLTQRLSRAWRSGDWPLGRTTQRPYRWYYQAKPKPIGVTVLHKDVAAPPAAAEPGVTPMSPQQCEEALRTVLQSLEAVLPSVQHYLDQWQHLSSMFRGKE